MNPIGGALFFFPVAFSTFTPSFRFQYYFWLQAILTRLGDFRGLMEVYVSRGSWEEASALLAAHPEFGPVFYPAYAKAQIAQDNFENAFEAYLKAGEPAKAMGILEGARHRMGGWV